MSSLTVCFWVVLAFHSIYLVETQGIRWVGGSLLADQVATLTSPGGRSGAAVWQTNNSALLFAGMGISSFSDDGSPALLNDVWRHGDDGWSQVHPGTVSNLTVAASRSPEIPRPRQLAAACGIGGVMVVFGGVGAGDSPLGDLWVLDVAKRQWRMLVEVYNASTGNPGPAPRGDNAYWCTATHMWVFGGRGLGGQLLGDMWRLGLQDLRWQEVPSSRLAPKALRDHTTADFPAPRNGAMTWAVRQGRNQGEEGTQQGVVQGEEQYLYLYGGNVLTMDPPDRHIATAFTSDLWRYAVGSDSWRYLLGDTHPGQAGRYGEGEALPGCRRGGVAWADTTGRLWLIGGEGTDGQPPSRTRSAKLLSDIWRFDPDDLRWQWVGGSRMGDSRSEKSRPGGRVDGAGWGQGKAILLFGGLGHGGGGRDGYLSDLWALETYTSPWLTIPGVLGIGVAIAAALTLLLCVAVLALYARDRGRTPEWRRGGAGKSYRQLDDSDA